MPQCEANQSRCRRLSFPSPETRGDNFDDLKPDHEQTLEGTEDSIYRGFTVYYSTYHVAPVLAICSSDSPERETLHSICRHEIAQQANTTAKVDEGDVPTCKRIERCRSYMWPLLTEMSFEILDVYAAAQGGYNGAIVQAQEAGLTRSQPVCTFPSQRGIS